MPQLTLEEATELGLQFHLTGRLGMARHYYGLVLHHNRDYGPAVHLAASLPRHEGLGEAAIRDDVLARPIDHPVYLTMLGRALAGAGWAGAGLECLRRALAQEPAFPRALDSLAALLPGTPMEPFPLAPHDSRLAQGAEPLVLATATGYSVKNICPFIRSLRRHYDGPVVVLVDDDPAVRRFLDEHRIEALVRQPGRWLGINIQTARYLYYAEYLQAAGGRYGRVLMSDVRDVFFQGDPFDHDLDGDLFYFLEEPGSVIGGCANNQLWIKGCFGRAVYDRLKECRITCSGTTLGTAAAVERYLRLMIITFSGLPRLISGGQGHDQAVHNMIAHVGLIAGGVFVENHRHIGTLHHTPAEDLEARPGGVLAHRDGSVSKVVHQYDRHPHLKTLVERLYG
ncbi:MAG TPA: hypothetical protein VEB64_01185 [Azospirillaceae bacterium]|nr:hypothetical protein [Azospirillaceae bacterium]